MIRPRITDTTFNPMLAWMHANVVLRDYASLATCYCCAKPMLVQQHTSVVLGDYASLATCYWPVLGQPPVSIVCSMLNSVLMNA